jgi:type II secretory pathway component PulC
MAENGPLTPEKQLLKLIEGSKDAAPRSSGAASPQSLGRGRFSLGALRGALVGRFSFFRRTAQKKLASPKRRSIISLTAVNRTLAVAVFAAFLYVAGDALASAIALQRPANFTANREASGAASSDRVSPLNESAYYLQKVAARDIFKEGGQPAVSKEVSKGPVSVESNPATSSLSLVGISWSANPDVIIEDKERKRTYFVKRGQVVGDGVKVEAIFKDHVVLSYEGQEFELR